MKNNDSWEERFYEEFIGKGAFTWKRRYSPEEMMEFIQSELDRQRKEHAKLAKMDLGLQKEVIIEELEGMKKPVPDDVIVRGDEVEVHTHNQAIDEAIEKTKKLEK